jgi:hypothetical protein
MIPISRVTTAVDGLMQVVMARQTETGRFRQSPSPLAET